MRLITRVSLSLARQQTAHAPVCVKVCARRESFFWNAKCSGFFSATTFFPTFSFSSIFHLSLSLVLCRARGMLLFEFEVPVYYPFKKGKQKISEMIYACWRRVCAHEVNIALFSLALSWNEICSCRFFPQAIAACAARGSGAASARWINTPCVRVLTGGFGDTQNMNGEFLFLILEFKLMTRSLVSSLFLLFKSLSTGWWLKFVYICILKELRCYSNIWSKAWLILSKIFSKFTKLAFAADVFYVNWDSL